MTKEADNFTSQLLSLYRQSFNESEAYVNYFFENRYRPENVVSVTDGAGRIISALHLFPVKIMIDGKAVKAGFVSSAATLPELRGKGVFFDTMEKAYERLKRDGAEYCLLYPFKHEYYKRHGFIEYTYVLPRTVGTAAGGIPYRIERYTAGDTGFAAAANDIYRRCCAPFEGYVIRDLYETRYRLNEAASDGAEIYLVRGENGESGYAYLSNGKLEECCFTDFARGEGAPRLVDSVKEFYGAEYIVPVCLPLERAAVYPGAVPFGMIKKLSCPAGQTFDFFRGKSCILFDKY